MVLLEREGAQLEQELRQVGLDIAAATEALQASLRPHLEAEDLRLLQEGLEIMEHQLAWQTRALAQSRRSRRLIHGTLLPLHMMIDPGLVTRVRLLRERLATRTARTAGKE
jgi:hypothetical protein